MKNGYWWTWSTLHPVPPGQITFTLPTLCNKESTPEWERERDETRNSSRLQVIFLRELNRKSIKNCSLHRDPMVQVVLRETMEPARVVTRAALYDTIGATPKDEVLMHLRNTSIEFCWSFSYIYLTNWISFLDTNTTSIKHYTLNCSVSILFCFSCVFRRFNDLCDFMCVLRLWAADWERCNTKAYLVEPTNGPISLMFGGHATPMKLHIKEKFQLLFKY